MRKIYAAILLLLSVSFPSFQRPWQNSTWVSENPNIWSFGSELWWNVQGFQDSLDSFGPQVPPELADETTRRSLESGLASAESAKGLRDSCLLRMLGSLGVFPVSPAQSFIGLFSKTSECTRYRERWKQSVGYFLDAAESSLSAAEDSVAEAGEAYDSLVFSGLCESDYFGPGSEGCSGIRNSMLGANGDIKEGDYGKYALALDKMSELESGLHAHVPDLSAARTIVDLAWKDGGIVDSFGAVKAMAESMEENASAEFHSRYSSAQAAKASMQSRLGQLEKKGFLAIGRSPSGSSEAGSISTRFSESKRSAQEISLLISGSKADFESVHRPGYLASSVDEATLADEMLDELSARLSELDEDAERTVSEQEEETLAELEYARAFVRERGGSESLSYLERAEATFDNAARAPSLGKRFELLSESAALARSAKARDAGQELAESASLSTLKELIRKAELDGINAAPEKEAVQVLESLPAPVASVKAKEFMDSLVSRSRSAYEPDLAEQRRRILEKISLAGPDAADLESDLGRIEKGLVSEGAVIFPDAIGSLSSLASDYGSLESELDAYMLEIVGNSMSATADPLVIGAKLDAPSEVILELVLTNPTSYSAKNVQARILLGRPFSFMLSEISSAREEVASVRMAEGNRVMMLTLPEVAPYETRRVTFSKMQVLARKLRETASSEGLGGGLAAVSREIEFELETDVKSITLPDGIPNPKIDGQAKTGPLAAGKHILVSEAVLEDAYLESVENVRVYGIGLNSKVEFDIAIEPSIDLVKVPVFIDSLNDSGISSFEITSASGETVKNKRRVSDTQVAAEIGGLKKGRRALIRVSYLVENTRNLVERQLAIFGALNLSDAAGAIFEKAKGEAASGNYPEALSLLEKSKAAQKEAEAREAKNLEKFRSLSGSAMDQIALLESVVSESALNDTFIQKLGSRKSELEKALAASNETDFTGLEKLDGKWLERELGALRKEIYKKYNDLKERFYLAGNFSTPPEFLAFEESLIALESGENPEYAVDALEALDRVSSLVELQETSFRSEKESLTGTLGRAKAGLLSSWDAYSRQSSAAKGTDFSSMFSETERSVNSLIKEAESSVDDPHAFAEALEKIGTMEEKLDGTMESLKEAALSRISLIEETPGNSVRIAELRLLVERGDYVNALRGAASLSKEPEKETGDDPSLPIIGLTALAILGAAGFYMMKPKKELRRLNSWKVPEGDKKVNQAKLSS